jgi:hypothetical protein
MMGDEVGMMELRTPSTPFHTRRSTTKHRKIVSVIYSDEGTRTGCRLGSTIFDMVFHPIYEVCGEVSGVCHSPTHG